MNNAQPPRLDDIYMYGKMPDSEDPSGPGTQSAERARLACLVYGCKQR